MQGWLEWICFIQINLYLSLVCGNHHTTLYLSLSQFSQSYILRSPISTVQQTSSVSATGRWLADCSLVQQFSKIIPVCSAKLDNDTCNLLCFKQDATKWAINFADKKNSNFFELFSAKLIWFCHCHREQGNKGSIGKQFRSFACQSWSQFRLKLMYTRRAKVWNVTSQADFLGWEMKKLKIANK